MYVAKAHIDRRDYRFKNNPQIGSSAGALISIHIILYG
jgi:predicted alpha/beta superfamily hydrolase